MPDLSQFERPGRIAQSVGHLTRNTFASPFADSKGAVVSYWRKYVHEDNHLGGLSLPRKSVVRLTDRSDMTLDVYRGRKTTTTTISSKNEILSCTCKCKQFCCQFSTLIKYDLKSIS